MEIPTLNGYYSNTKPSLVSNTTNNKLIKNIISSKQNNTSSIITGFIREHLVIIIVVIIICIILAWRYKIQQKKIKTEDFMYDEGYERDNNGNLIYTRDNINSIMTRPTFNPSIPVEMQESYTRYLPDEVNNMEGINSMNDIQGSPYIGTSDMIGPYEVLDDIQYNNSPRIINKGPFYRNAIIDPMNVSDINNLKFREANNTNLANYNEIIRSKNNFRM